MQIVYKKGLRNAYAKEVSGEVKLIIPYALKKWRELSRKDATFVNETSAKN